MNEWMHPIIRLAIWLQRNKKVALFQLINMLGVNKSADLESHSY